MAISKLREEVEQLLRNHKFPTNLQAEEDKKKPSLQSYMTELVNDKIKKLNDNVEIVTAVGGTKGTAPSIKLLGTSFWPDVAFQDKSTGEKIALELKLVMSRAKLSSAISSAVGQCLIYRTMYSEAIGFVLVYGNARVASPHDQDELLKKMLETLKTNGILLIIRNP